MKTLISLIASCIALAVISCSIEHPNDSPPVGQFPVLTQSEVIPLETALESLKEFLAQTEAMMLPTKSGGSRRIATVDSYYGDSAPTKAAELRGTEDLPIAYVVNFEDNEGFAVLGAKTTLPAIVAVTENGSIDAGTLDVTLRTGEEQWTPLFPEDDEDDPLPPMDADSLYYCAEDDDYYSDALVGEEQMVREFIRCGVIEGIEYGSGAGTPAAAPVPTPPSPVSPLLNTNWDQGLPYSAYCKRGTRKNKDALVGCSALALGMILTCNEFPDTLSINGRQINWADMKSSVYIDFLSNTAQDDVKLLLASIYYKVNKCTGKSYTMITPEQIRKRMIALGYTTVVKTKSCNFTSAMLNQTVAMLTSGKPVFLSAIPGLHFTSAHSWVIDGTMYDTNNECLVHMNLGWKGDSNGYYSIKCLNPERARLYDSSHTYNNDYDRTFNWHFRLITYDIPNTITFREVNY